MLILPYGRFHMVMDDDPTYTPNSADNLYTYNKVYELLVEPGYRPSTQHSIIVKEQDTPIHSCILISGGGPTRVHSRSALIYNNKCIAAVGPFMCCLNLPDLNMEWYKQVDWVTCFGVYHSLKHNCFISHGELDIARVTYEGQMVWSTSGKDIFTNGFTLYDDYIEAIDFYNEKYHIDLETGRCQLSD